MFKSLLLPPGAFLVLALIGFLMWRRTPKFSQITVVVAFALLFLMSTPLISGAFLRSLQWYPSLPADAIDSSEAKAIVVLGAGVKRDRPEYEGDTIDLLALERLRYAARLKRRTGLPVLITGGHSDEEVRPVAILMAESLEEDFGLEAEWIEGRSLNTEYNARLSRDILGENGIATIYLVTHAWHMPRSKASFERQGITVVPAPMGFSTDANGVILGDLLPHATALAASSYATHEWIGIAWYWLWYDVLGQ